MSSIKCLIVDDEELARKLLSNYIDRLSHLEIVGEAANPLEAMSILQSQQVDLLFLDIQMPELTGIQFLKTISNQPLVIFTTAYKEYALDGFELNAIDYLLKPFRFERFLQAVNKASQFLKKHDSPLPLGSSSKREMQDNLQKNYITVKSEFKVYRILLDDILYIESMKEYVAYYTIQGRTLSLGSLKSLEEELPPNQFLRIHKSYIVSRIHVKALEGNMVHIADKKLPIGGTYREEVLEKLF